MKPLCEFSLATLKCSTENRYEHENQVIEMECLDNASIEFVDARYDTVSCEKDV